MNKAKEELDRLIKLQTDSNENIERLNEQLRKSLCQIGDLKEKLENSNKICNLELQNTFEKAKMALISKHDDQVKRLEKEIYDLKIEINNLKGQFTAEKDKNNQLIDQLKNSEIAVDEFQSKLNKSNAELERIKTVLKDSIKELDSILKEKGELDDQICSKNSKLDEANKENNLLKIQLLESNANLDQLNKRLKESDKNIGNLNDKLTKSYTICNKELQKLHETEKSSLISIHEDQVKRLENENTDLKKKINDLITAKKHSSDMESEQKQAVTTAEALKSQLNEKTGIVNSLKDHLKKSDLIIDDLKSQLNESKQHCDQLFKEKNQTILELEKFKTDNDDFKILIKQRKELMDSQTLEVAKLNGLINKLNQDITVKTIEIDELNTKIVGLEDENKILYDKNRDLTNQVFDQDNLQTEWNLKNSYATHDNQLNELQSQIDRLKNENNILTYDFEKLSRTNCDLENKILNAETTANLLKSQLNESKKSSESLNSQLNETNAKVKDLNDQLKNSVLICEDVKRQLNESKTSFDLMHNGLQYQLECLKIENVKHKNENRKLSRTNCDLQNQNFNLNASISLSSTPSTGSLSQAEIQSNELKDINLSLTDQIKKLRNHNTILLGEGNRLFNEHNALKISAELMMTEGNSLLKEKNLLLIQLRDAKNDQSLKTQKLNAEISKLKKDLCELK
jgi:chromosome segregation ATPase